MADEPARAAVLSHLVYLDVDDEITSAAARIRATDAEQVTLVLPYGSRLATSRINFRLLAREANERGKRLDIVCVDGSARALAAAAGLPVHASVAAFEASRGAGTGGGPSANGKDGPDGPAGAGAATAGAVATTQLALPELADEDDAPTRIISVPRRSSPRVPLVGPARPPVRPRVAVAAGLGIVAGLLVLGLLAFQLLPAATIVLHPRSQAVGPIALTVLARSDVLQPDATNLVIPAQRFTFPLEATDTFTATGTKPVDTRATGNVTFTNYDTSSSNRIPAGSIVSTKAGVDFATLDDVVVSASPIFPFPPSKASVGVQAVEAGPSGNVDAGTITVVPRTENKHLLDVTNEDPTGGGAHEDRTVVSAGDIATAQATLQGALREQLDTRLAGATGLPSGIRLFAETASVGAATPSVDTSTLVGTETAQFELGATADGSVLGVDSSPIQGLAEGRIGTKVEAGWTLADGSTAVQLGEPSVLGDVISFPVTVSASEVRNVDQAGLLAQIRGLALPQARTRLEPFGTVSISVWPDWVTTIPANDDRIDFSIGEPQPAPSPTP
ncbi:MAG TPA: baseplate J/gp47 family protein [Patescibacteria group bacterium]|nr:baseplate J/gp47 family protein [Patescibacteria group bacterium]